jgi:hypothetical protein
VTVRAIFPGLEFLVAVEADLHSESFHFGRQSFARRNITVAPLTLDTGDDDVAAVGVEDVGRLAKKRTPLQGFSRREKTDESLIVRAIADGIFGMAERAGLRRRPPGKGLVLDELVTRCAFQFQLLDMESMIEW